MYRHGSPQPHHSDQDFPGQRPAVGGASGNSVGNMNAEQELPPPTPHSRAGMPRLEPGSDRSWVVWIGVTVACIVVGALVLLGTL